MNIFVIPSWFPSNDHPISGTMIQEQTESFCRLYPFVNIGISIWGQQDEIFLLWSKDHVKNLRKLFTANTNPYTETILPNLKVYHSPTFTWTRKILNGNMKNIVKANVKNLKAFEAENGSTDIIHAHVGYPAGLIAMEVAEKLNKQFCLTERMGPFPWPQTVDKNGILTSYFRQPYIKSATNIAVSPFQAEVMHKQGIGNTIVIPNFVNENEFVPAPQESTNSTSFTFFSLSYIAPNKGTDVLVYATYKLLQKNKNIRLRVGGGGPFLAACIALASDLGIAENISWLGDIDRRVALLEFQNCDAFVLPSQYESMGIVYVEAIACGKPIIATRCGGPEATVSAANGLLVEKDNPQELAKAMEYMISNREQYKSSIIREDFLKRFSTKAVAPKLYNLYQSIMQQSHR